MTPAPRRVVYDCNIYAQALINLRGPAARCVEKAREGVVSLFASPFILAEVRELHHKIPKKYGVTAEQTGKLANKVASFATIITAVPEVYHHPIDPDDSHYVNLALRADAKLVVSRDRHLLNLMDQSRKEAKEFRIQFPTLRIIDPVQLLQELEQEPDPDARAKSG